MNLLKQAGAEYTQLWSSNEIFVKYADIRIISGISDVFENVAVVRPEGIFKSPQPIASEKRVPTSDLKEDDDIAQPIQQMNGRCKDIKMLGRRSRLRHP